MRTIFIEKKTTLKDYLYATIFSIVVGVVLGLIYLSTIGELPCFKWSMSWAK
jgi:hypothetical protein